MHPRFQLSICQHFPSSSNIHHKTYLVHTTDHPSCDLASHFNLKQSHEQSLDDNINEATLVCIYVGYCSPFSFMLHPIHSPPSDKQLMKPLILTQISIYTLLILVAVYYFSAVLRYSEKHCFAGFPSRPCQTGIQKKK